MHHPGYSSGFSQSPAEDQPTPAPYTDYPGASYLVDLCFTPPVQGPSPVAPQPPSVIWKETPESHQGCAFPGSRDPCRLQSWEVGTHYPMGLSSLILLGPPKCCRKNVRPARIRLKPRCLEERKIYYASGPAPWISPKVALARQLKAAGFLCLNAEARKLEEQKQMWQLASC
jgi:hypothetical protein